MNTTEFEAKLNLLNVEHLRAKRLLFKQYAMSNSSVNVNDIIEDHIGKVLVTEIDIYVTDSKPMCKYYGYVLLKSGTPTKRKDMRYIFQSNLKRDTNG